MPDQQNEQEPVSQTPPPPKAQPTPAQSLAAQYDLGDEVLPSVAVPGEADDAPPASRPSPPKDPDTGRFVSPAKAHPALLVRQAKDLGISEEEIAEADTSDLRYLVREINAEKRQNDLILSLHGIRPPAAPAEAAPAALDLGINEEVVEPSIAAALKKLAADNRDLRQQVERLSQHQQRQEQETGAQKMDRLFDKYGDKVLFGDGPGSEMSEDSAELQRRVAVINIARGLQGNFEQNFRKVVSTLFSGTKPEKPPEKPGKPAKNGTAVSPEEWQEAALAVPTQRIGAQEPYGVERAKAAVRALTKERAPSGGDTSLDEIPD